MTEIPNSIKRKQPRNDNFSSEKRIEGGGIRLYGVGFLATTAVLISIIFLLLAPQVTSATEQILLSLSSQDSRDDVRNVPVTSNQSATTAYVTDVGMIISYINVFILYFYFIFF